MIREPDATYRLPMRAGLGFAEAAALVPYLHDLGITHLHFSPVFQARSGSTHGYDIVNPQALSAEPGGEEAFDALAAEASRHGMGLLLNIVPNHMAASTQNPWWMDVLENGVDSPYAGIFRHRLGPGAGQHRGKGAAAYSWVRRVLRSDFRSPSRRNLRATHSRL